METLENTKIEAEEPAKVEPEVKEETFELEFVKLETSENFNRSWHKKIQGVYKIFTKEENKPLLCFKITGNPSGCGSVIVNAYYTWTRNLDLSRKNKKLKSFIQKEIFEKLKTNGVGLIITNLGDTYYNYKSDKLQILEKLFDMTAVAEYKNYRHGEDKQKLFIRAL